MAMRNGYLLHLVVPPAFLSRPQNASRISFPFGCLDAWPHFCLTSDLSAFCYRHKMQLRILACGKQSFACLAAGKMQLGLHKHRLLCGRSSCILSRPQNASRISFPFSYLDAWPHFCLTSDLSAFCYRYKMQLGTLACGKQSSACLAAGKMPLGLRKHRLLCGRSSCILSRPQNASRIPFPFSYLDAWPHFCLTSDLSGILLPSQNATGKSAINKERQQPTSLPGDISSRETPSAFWPAPRMQMSRLISIKRDSSPHLFLTTFLPGRLHLHFGPLPKCR